MENTNVHMENTNIHMENTNTHMENTNTHMENTNTYMEYIVGHLKWRHILHIVGVVERIVAAWILPAVTLVAVNFRSS